VILYLAPRSGVPLVHFRILVKGGTESDPQTLPGLSAITAELLDRGAGTRTADQFSDQLDSLGGVFRAHSDELATEITAEFLEKDFDRGLGLLADAVLRPTFAEPEVKKVIAQQMDAIKAARDNPQAAIGRYWSSFFFGAAHPYGRPADERALDRIQRKDVVDYHRQMYTGRNLVIIVTGQFDPAAARAKIAQVFGSAPAGLEYTWLRDAPLPSASGPRLLLVDKPDATQTYFRIGTPGVQRTNPDRVPLLLVNTLFGGRFTSILNDELRVNSGLTYGATSAFQQARLTGAFSINTFTRTEATGKAIDLAIDLLKRFHEHGITSEQLESVKAYVKGTYPPRRLETIDQIAQTLGELELFGLPRDEVDMFFQRVDSVSLADANQVIRKYYRPENLTFVLVGNAAKIRDSAAKYAPKMIERSIKDPGWAS
jgi:predicted Zn-dependent peptidase